MLDALTGFVVVGVPIVVGYIVGRVDLLGQHVRPVLARLTFFVLSPFLLFVVLSHADVALLFSALLPVSAIAALTVTVIFGIVAKVFWRRGVGDIVIGALSAGQVNANNIGIPLSLYLLGSAAYSAPVVLLQIVTFTPVALAILDAGVRGKVSVRRVLKGIVTNPLLIGSILGVLVAVAHIDLPPIVTAPIALIADACIPILLISYGISLNGARVLSTRGRRRDILMASGLKLLVMPLVAWMTARLFGLSPHETLVVTVLAALPTAQNIFNFSQHYKVGETISRDTVFVTTIGCVPIVLALTFVLG